MRSDLKPLTVTRRAAIGALGAAALGFAAFGPRPRRERVDGRIVLDYWEKWTGHEGAAMRAIVDEFNESQSDCYVRYFAMSAIDQKALIAIAGNSPPDILGLWNFNIPAYAESGALMPLTEMAAAAGLTRQRYAAGVWPLITHQDQLWGLVSTCGSIALFYNRALFREVGLDPDRPPRTIEELDEYNRRLTVVEGGGGAGSGGGGVKGGRIARMGFIHTEPGWWSWLWGYFFGGTLYEPWRRPLAGEELWHRPLAGEGENQSNRAGEPLEADVTGQRPVPRGGRATAASAANVRGYEWVQTWPERFGVEALQTFQSGLGFYGSAEHPFLTGRVAMTNQGPWLANNIVAFKPDLDYAAAPFPVASELYDPQQPIGLLDADVLVIPRGARRPELSFRFIEYCQQQGVMERLARAHCKNSPLAVSSSAFLEDHPHRSIRAHDAIANSPRAFVFPRTRTWPQYEADFNAGMQRMWTLAADAATTLKRIERRAQAAIDHAARQRERRARLKEQSS